MKAKKCLKAQAAMEFIMTYGWAILVVLVAIGEQWNLAGALAYFGVLNVDNFAPMCSDMKTGQAIGLCKNITNITMIVGPGKCVNGMFEFKDDVKHNECNTTSYCVVNTTTRTARYDCR